MKFPGFVTQKSKGHTSGPGQSNADNFTESSFGRNFIDTLGGHH